MLNVRTPVILKGIAGAVLDQIGVYNKLDKHRPAEKLIRKERWAPARR